MTCRALLVVACLTSGQLATGLVQRADAADPPCPRDYCVGDEIRVPGTVGSPGSGVPAGRSGDPGRDGNGDGPRRPPAPRCTWVRDPGPLPLAINGVLPAGFLEVGSPPAGDAHLIYERCDGELTGQVQWATPTAAAPGGPSAPASAPAPPDPEELAATVRVRLEGDLPEPVVHTSPPPGEPAVVNHPAFLAVDNWTGTITDRECALLLCVTVTATPALTWSPGEPDAPTLTCQGAGTRYDPDGPPPQEQAARPGACAYAFRSRTAAAGRPSEWPGSATVTWDLSWTSTSGASGDLPATVRTTEVPRAVEEVQALVVR